MKLLPPKSMKWPNLERNSYLAIFALILLLTLGSCWMGQKIERSRQQYLQDQQAIKDGHAVEVRP